MGWLGRMGHSSNFARWPHFGPIPPMDGGGHLVPLSYVYGYRGGIGRRSSVKMAPATVRSEPTTEQSAGRCAQHFTTKVRAMQLAAFSANQAWCQPIRAIVIFAL